MQGGVNCLSVASDDYYVFPYGCRWEILDSNDVGLFCPFHSQGIAQTAACEDERIGLFAFDKRGVDFVLGYELYSANLELFFHIRPQSIKVLVGPFDR